MRKICQEEIRPFQAVLDAALFTIPVRYVMINAKEKGRDQTNDGNHFTYHGLFSRSVIFYMAGIRKKDNFQNSRTSHGYQPRGALRGHDRLRFVAATGKI